jgi:hypothetical protein
MKKRLLVLLDLIDLIERGGMDEIVYEFLEEIVMTEIKDKKLSKKASSVVNYLKKRRPLW